ncbi:MAG: hypothetical protein AAB903_03835 [Patescibacteria group bacterium]
MTIEWNKVTWYSKLLALILFVALPFIGFYLGMMYQEMRVAGYEGRRILQSQLTTNNSQLATDASTSLSASTSTSSTSLTASWKTYRNEKYGFEFMYPPTIGVRFEEEYITVFHHLPFGREGIEPVSFNIEVNSNKDDLDVFEYYDGNPGIDVFGDSHGKYQSLFIGGIKSYRLDPYSANGSVFIIPRDNSFIHIFDSMFVDKKGRQIEDQIFSTFKFTK